MNILQLLADSPKLTWHDDIGIGYYPVAASPYDDAYWQRYRAMDDTPMGEALTAARLALCAEHHRGIVCDIGIGGGRFVSAGGYVGYDINPAAVRWLIDNCIFGNPYKYDFTALSFWDSFEHIKDPGPLLEHCLSWVFMSIPIFEDEAHALRSKHFRPTEHCWYFTERGLINVMRNYGFRMVASNSRETELGREDIKTFVFRRIRDGD